jgi:hypothetical protein
MTLFSASFIKLTRASGFIQELEREFERYKSDEVLRYRYELDPSGVLDVILDPIFPGELPGAIIGDAVNNLRTALDLMATELVAISGGNPTGVYFPFASSAGELDDQIRNKKFDRAGTEAVWLLKTFAPYVGGNKALREMHDLDIQDKHKAILISAPSYSGRMTLIRNEQGILEPGPFVVTAVRVVFPENSALAGEEILPTLKHLMEMVEGILKAFAALVAARTP